MEASKQSDVVLRRPARCENALRTSAPIHNKGCHNVSMIESISEYLEAPVPSSPRRNPCSTSRGSNNEITIPQCWENSRDVNDDTEHSPNVCEAQEYVYHSGTSSVTKWEIMFKRLLVYKEKHGHCLVPNRYKDDKKLGLWVSMQRRQYKAYASDQFDATALSLDRIQRLEDIGFVWRASTSCRVEWDVRFRQLQTFFQDHGHTLVPMCYEENPALSHWVRVQRQAYKTFRQGMPSKMTEERIRLLDSVKFVWRAPRGPRRRRASAAVLPVVQGPNNGSHSEVTALTSLLVNSPGTNGHNSLGPISSHFATNHFQIGSWEVARLAGASRAHSVLDLGTDLTSLNSGRLPPSYRPRIRPHVSCVVPPRLVLPLLPTTTIPIMPSIFRGSNRLVHSHVETLLSPLSTSLLIQRNRSLSITSAGEFQFPFATSQLSGFAPPLPDAGV